MQYFAVFGNPIAQSKSPAIHQMFAQQVKLNIDYRAILAPIGGFETSAAEFFAQPHRANSLHHCRRHEPRRSFLESALCPSTIKCCGSPAGVCVFVIATSSGFSVCSFMFPFLFFSG